MTHSLRGTCEGMDPDHIGVTSLGPAEPCPVSSSHQLWRHWGHGTLEEILPLRHPATFLSFFSCSSASSNLDALAVHSHLACVGPCSSGAVRINYHFINESALNHLGVSAEPKYSSVVIDMNDMNHYDKLLIICSAQLGLCQPWRVCCMCPVFQLALPTWGPLPETRNHPYWDSLHLWRENSITTFWELA